MSASNFESSLSLVLKDEGGYVNDARDPGGATNLGITQRTYDLYRRGIGKPVQDVRQISQDEVESIYRRGYWNACRCDELPAGLDYTVFDAAVNSGPAQAAKWLQRIAGAIVDGKIGPQTLASVARLNVPQTIDAFCLERIEFLKTVRHKKTGALLWTTYGKGWQRRVSDVRTNAKAMVAR